MNLYTIKNYLHIENAFLKMEMNIPRMRVEMEKSLYMKKKIDKLKIRVEEIMIENGHFHVWHPNEP